MIFFLKIMRRGVSVLSFVLFCLPAIFCQQEGADSIRNRFNQYGGQYLQEKLYVHTDRSFYLAGEIIWFKIYDVDGGSNRPLDLSKMAYIEVISADQKALVQAKIQLANGTGSGSFFLPLSFNSGVYKIRAYTNWMKNYSPDYFFEKPVTIVNSLKTLGISQAVNTSAFDIQFFPEGGNLVDGIQSKIAFRIVDQNGKGVDCRGAIIDQNGDTIVQFRPLKFGIGHFYFTPSVNKKYKAGRRPARRKASLNPALTKSARSRSSTTRAAPEDVRPVPRRAPSRMTHRRRISAKATARCATSRAG